MGYKLINCKFHYGPNATYYFYANSWKAYINRICECANFTLDSEGGLPYQYYAYMNNGEYCCNYGSPQSGQTSGFYIGLPKKNSGNYTCYGFYMYIDSATPTTKDGSRFKLIVDDNNNLVYCSKILGDAKGNEAAQGFILTNGGVKKIEETAVYAPSASSGAEPAQVATMDLDGTGFGLIWQGQKNDDEIFKSNILGVDMSNNFIIVDHVLQLMSSRIYHPRLASTISGYKTIMAGDSAYEVIFIDGKHYLHLYSNLWIEIDEIRDEIIEVVAT